MRTPASALSGAPIDLQQAWVFTDRDGVIVDATSAAAAMLHTAFHRLVRRPVLDFVADGRDAWARHLASIHGRVRVARVTRVQPTGAMSVPTVLTLEPVTYEGRELRGWHLIPRLEEDAETDAGKARCRACGSIRLVVIERPHGVDCECERCGYIWHCDNASVPDG
jgi:hypothetical protein